ncbi:MAG: ATP-dependent RecD-like DNA helicase [Mogibacterium sp.]|nr:ATP-dependent RecD-like DNA helicase [Mogibacterium sp.]
MTGQMQQTGTLSRVIFNNPENGYTVAVFDTDEGSMTIVGSFAEPKPGARYRLDGRFVIHKKYGEQFSFSSFEELLPVGEDAILEFLSAGNIRGIGPKTAKLIVDTFGAESLKIIEEKPEQLLMINGIGPKSLEKIRESFLESRDFANASIELREMGIEMSDAVRIYKIYGSDSIDAVKENPYMLVEDIRGMTFPKADLIAEKLGFAHDSSFRIESGIRYVLRSWAVSGSTLMPEEMLTERTAALLDVTREEVRDSIRDMVFNGELEEDTADDIRVIYLYGYYHAEQRIAYNLIRIRNAQRMAVPALIDDLINDAEADMAADLGEIYLSAEQRAAVAACLENNVSIITGGPGTGKTTIINTLVRIFRRLDMSTALAAPTGRAAKRMEEASGEPAMTIHRLLEYVYSDDEDILDFGRDEDNPLEQQVVIVDEASMIDTMLMDGLLQAVKDGTILIFTGDADQLPAVGAGNVLRDIIASEVIHTTRLREIFRQAGDSRIITNSHRINNGEMPEQGSRDSDFFMLRRDDEAAVLELIRELVSGRLERGYDFVRSAADIQLLTPTKRGALGAPNLNSVLQEVLNPAEEGKPEITVGNRTFRLGDKVMQLRNNYTAEWHDDDWNEGEGIFNGDMGTVESIDAISKSMTVRSDDRLITYSGEMFEELDLAYAVTVHKSQGSEFPVVIIPMWRFPPMLMTRNLLYTAVTRGKRLVLLIGDPRCIRYMVDNNRADERYTGLKSRLKSSDYSVALIRSSTVL